jgi:hypothetical protein
LGWLQIEGRRITKREFVLQGVGNLVVYSSNNLRVTFMGWYSLDGSTGDSPSLFVSFALVFLASDRYLVYFVLGDTFSR